MTPQWIIAFVVFASGMLLGEIAGRIVRGSMSRPERSAHSREMARPLGSFLFWSGTVTGIILGIASWSPSTLGQVPNSAVDHLPNIIAAGLFLIGGYAVSLGLSAMVGQSALRASGTRHRGLERALRIGVVAASIALALSQLGVDTTILALVLVTLLAAPALALALLTAFGGRDIAANLSAGRALRHQLQVGRHLSCEAGSGLITAVHPVTVELLGDAGDEVHVPMRLLLEQPFVVTPLRVRT